MTGVPTFCISCGKEARGTVTLRCGACGKIHYLNSKLSASALVVRGSDYLVVKRGAEPQLGWWDLPGGFCEYGEDPVETARRETFEESGVDVTINGLLGVWMDEYVEPDGERWPTVNLIYLARLADPSAVVGMGWLARSGETTALRWSPLASPPDEIAFPKQQLGAIEAYSRME